MRTVDEMEEAMSNFVYGVRDVRGLARPAATNTLLALILEVLLKIAKQNEQE